MRPPDDAIRERFPHVEIVPDTFDTDLDHIRQLGNQVFAGTQQLTNPRVAKALLDKWIIRCDCCDE